MFSFSESEMEIDELIESYKQDAKPAKEPEQPISTRVERELSSDEEPKSPVLIRRSNPFKRTSDANEVSPSLLQRSRRRLPIKGRFKPTVIDNTAVAQSEFFAPKPKVQPNIEEEEPMDLLPESMITNVDAEDCKENLNFPTQRVIIPETEDFDDAMVSLIHFRSIFLFGF